MENAAHCTLHKNVHIAQMRSSLTVVHDFMISSSAVLANLVNKAVWFKFVPMPLKPTQTFRKASLDSVENCAIEVE